MDDGSAYDPRFLALGVRLTKQEARLDGVSVAGSCLASWRGAGQRLRDDPAMDLDDYLDAVYARSTMQRLLTALPDHVAVKISRAVVDVDRNFRANTMPDERGLLANYEGGGDSGWWWQRIPAAGKALDMLLDGR